MTKQSDARRLEVRRWLRFAEEDLIAARILLREQQAAPRHVCWLAQQAAEKALKAVFVFLQLDFPRTHSLDRLRNLLPNDWTAKGIYSDLAGLTIWAVEARYPGEWEEATVAEADVALRQAQAIFAAVSDDLRHRGLGI